MLNGRGVKIASHMGNLRFRAQIKQMRDDRYCENFSSSEKKALARIIIDQIKSLNPPGRFLKRHGNDGPWIELSKMEAEKKTKQALRDCNRTDRTGYAEQVATPQDVESADERRRNSGLTLQEHARNRVKEETRRRGRGSNANRRTLPTSGAATGSSRRPIQRGSTTAVAAANLPGGFISNQGMEETMPLPFPPMLASAPAQACASWAAASSTVNATPASRPYINAPLVSRETPDTAHSSFYQGSGHNHHQLNRSQPTSNPQPHPALAQYHDDYITGDTFEHHSSAAQAGNSVPNFTSPVVRSPIVTQSKAKFEAHQEPFPDDWTTGHHRQNLFGQDALDTLAANASANLASVSASDRAEQEMLMSLDFELNSGDMDNNDLALSRNIESAFDN